MKKFAFSSLPKGYELYKRIDLTKDRQAQKAVSLLGIAAALALIVPMLFVHPGRSFDMPWERPVLHSRAVVGMIYIYSYMNGLTVYLSGCLLEKEAARVPTADISWHTQEVTAS